MLISERPDANKYPTVPGRAGGLEKESDRDQQRACEARNAAAEGLRAGTCVLGKSDRQPGAFSNRRSGFTRRVKSAVSMEVHTKLGVLQHPHPSNAGPGAKKSMAVAIHRCALVANVRVYRTRMGNRHGEREASDQEGVPLCRFNRARK